MGSWKLVTVTPGTLPIGIPLGQGAPHTLTLLLLNSSSLKLKSLLSYWLQTKRQKGTGERCPFRGPGVILLLHYTKLSSTPTIQEYIAHNKFSLQFPDGYCLRHHLCHRTYLQFPVYFLDMRVYRFKADEELFSDHFVRFSFHQ